MNCRDTRSGIVDRLPVSRGLMQAPSLETCGV
jgi:hypothetical protein